ncbi:hypothetical protein PR048_013599 [Dryococelus australis]|uniref:DDE-1 domain-containing protein n=1 Tax=Dryococelus australis TaxID=614101 RepID=A0ABQ9HSM4_9NEOP|nr:hypothetical protein PR048_013599 [Dryococelus australis]
MNEKLGGPADFKASSRWLKYSISSFPLRVISPKLNMNNDRVTGMMCSNAIQIHCFLLMVIGKSKKSRCFKNVKCLSLGYKWQKKFLD